MPHAIFRILIVALVATAACLGVGARPQQPLLDRDKVMAELRPYQREFISRELDLTKDQERRFFPIYEEMNDRIDSLNEETRELERRTIDTPDASDTELEAAAQAVFDLKQKEGRIEAEYFEKFKEILTPRQLLKLKSAERKFAQYLMRHHRRLSRTRAERAE